MTAERCSSRRRSRPSSGPRRSGARARGPGRRSSRSQTGTVVRRRAGRAPWPCPSTSRRRPATTTVPAEPERPQGRRRRARRSTAPGFGSTSSKTPVSMPAASSTSSDPVDDARTRRTPGSVTTKARRAAGRARRASGRPLDRADPEPDAVAQAHLERAVGERGSRSDLEHVVDARVAPDRQPAPAARGVEPALGRRRRRGSRRSRPRRSRARRGRSIASGTGRRSPPNANSSSGRRPQRGQSSQSISASPPSPGRPGRGRAGSDRARTARSAPASGPWRSARPSPRRRPGSP